MLSETKMRCFVLLAKSLSFTDTACKMNISQQAVSKHLSQLEEELGFKLIERTKRSVTLTESGKSCYTLFNSFLNTYDSFVLKNRESYKKSLIIKTGYMSWYNYGDAPLNALYKVREKENSFDLVGERSDDTFLLLKKLKEGNLDLVLIPLRKYTEDNNLTYEVLCDTIDNNNEKDTLICIFNKNNNNSILKHYISCLKKEYSFSNE